MIKVTLKDSSGTVDLSARAQATIEIDEQLDTSLDSGTIKYLTKEADSKGLNEALAGYSIITEDIVTDGGIINGLKCDFVGIDSRALVRREGDGQSIYSHQVSLTEPSKILQGVMIDGFAVTQPGEYRLQTLLDVVDRLFLVTPFARVIDALQIPLWFSLTKDPVVTKALHGVESPEFKWNTQTTLWECLLQVGAVIDAVPRLVADDKGNYTVVTFEFVNAYNNYVDAIDDGATNAAGESVDESQYNTALSTIVENVRENE